MERPAHSPVCPNRHRCFLATMILAILGCMPLFFNAAVARETADQAKIKQMPKLKLKLTPKPKPSVHAYSAGRAHAKRLALPAVVIDAMHKANFPDAALGVVVMRLSDNAMIVAHNANTSFAPASTMKLVPTFIGLDRLGPIHRGGVELHTTAARLGDVLKGDVVLRGLADMDFDWESLQRMLQTLRNQGIQTIDGNLIVDRHSYQPSRLDIGVPPFDESPEFRYNVIPDALNLNLNLLQLELVSDTAGMRIRVTPELDRVRVVSNMRFVDADCKDWEDSWAIPTQTQSNLGGIEIQLQGAFPRNCVANTSINVLDRAEYAARLFKSLWAKLGGSFNGAVIESSAPIPRGQLLAQHRSRPLGELVRDINKQSDNTFARMLYLDLGVSAAASGAADRNPNEAPSSAAENLPPLQGERQRNATPTLVFAEQVVRDWFAGQGIDTTGLVLENGSGLSRLERIRPAQLAGLLTAANRSQWAPEFMASLPIAGLDGTMRNRLKSSPAAGRARLKTGTLRDVSALAGYVPDATGQMCAVVAILNDPRADETLSRPVLDALVDWLVRTDTHRAARPLHKRKMKK